MSAFLHKFCVYVQTPLISYRVAIKAFLEFSANIIFYFKSSRTRFINLSTGGKTLLLKCALNFPHFGPPRLTLFICIRSVGPCAQ